jgi:Na+/H+ antiporter NhaD/arsenite permease-like protein
VGGVNRYGYAKYFGVVLVAVGAAALALTYPPPLDIGSQAVALVAAGVLHALSGIGSRVRERVGPHRLLGAGNILLGVSLAVSGLGDTGAGAELAYAAATVLGGASLAFVGVFYVFWPHHFGLGPDGYPVD